MLGRTCLVMQAFKYEWPHKQPRLLINNSDTASVIGIADEGTSAYLSRLKNKVKQSKGTDTHEWTAYVTHTQCWSTTFEHMLHKQHQRFDLQIESAEVAQAKAHSASSRWCCIVTSQSVVATQTAVLTWEEFAGGAARLGSLRVATVSNSICSESPV